MSSLRRIHLVTPSRLIRDTWRVSIAWRRISRSSSLPSPLSHRLCDCADVFQSSENYTLWWDWTNSRIWKEIRGDEDIFEGTGDKSFHTHSSTAQSPFIRIDPFHSDEEMRVAKIRRALNEIAVEDRMDEHPDTEVDNWSDVSVWMDDDIAISHPIAGLLRIIIMWGC